MVETPVVAIEHVENSSPAAFRLRRLSTGNILPDVVIPSPYEFPVEGKPNSNLMRELRWYLERFLDYPFPPDTTSAEHVEVSLKAWGTQAFNALFDRRDAPAWLDAAGLLQIRCNDPQVLSWPWEALYDLQTQWLAHTRRIERRLNELHDPPQLANLPNERVNILLVVARPYEGDVRYRSIARPLVELIASKHLPAHVDVLRPPTFDQLRSHLRAKPGYYHVLHFDGHGGYGASAPQAGHPFSFLGAQGSLVFEDSKGMPDPKSAGDLSTLLRKHAVPAVVLNACRSGTLDASAENAFSSVATALLQSGMRSVVAMAYSLYVSGAQVFLPAFYGELFEKGSVAEAVLAGRLEMLAHKERVCSRGRCPLQDWVLPVLYQQDPVDFSFAAQAKVEAHESHLPPEVLEYKDPYGFVGRDGAILAMERALHRKTPCVLVQGLGGVGKTTLARGFLRWLDETGGLDRALWFDFRNIRTAECVINRTGEAFYGANFGIAPNKLALLAEALRESRVIIVWDNFESAASNLTSQDRDQLGQFLDAIHGGRGKVMMTSRSREEWLGPTRRFELPLGGLDGEERWEYCEAIVEELGRPVNRNDEKLGELMDQLGGHPLAMRVVLQKLERMTASQILTALRTNLAELGLTQNGEEGRLFATLRFVEQGLPVDLRPLLGLVGLHEGYIDADYLEAMAKQVDAGWTRERVDRLTGALGSAGLLRDVGQATFEMHPLLTSYLRSQGENTPEVWQRAFVDVMGSLADYLAPKEHHEQSGPFRTFGASFHHALQLAERLSMETDFAALTQSLARHAQHNRDFIGAARLFEELVRHHADRGNRAGEAAACHQLGTIAQEQREFEAAREWYLKSLAIEEKQGNLPGAAITYHQLGTIAQEQREFEAARDWYLKSLAISEKQGDLPGAAITYHQLGSVAQEQREFEAAQEWCLKSLAISEKQGILHFAAITYHQLGIIAQEQREFEAARDWYLKSLTIKEKQGNLHGAASTYHQLGMIAQAQREFEAARDWYLKSLEIEERHGNLHGAASTYHQLGMIAQAQREFEAAREWYLKSLAIKEKQGNLHGAASTYAQLGNLAALQDQFEECGRWLIRSIRGYLDANDQRSAAQAASNFRIVHHRAPFAEKQKLETLWREAGFGDFPKEPTP